MSNFQIALIGIFIFFIIVGVVLFAGIKGHSTSESPEIVLWGSVSGATFNQFLNNFNLSQTTPLHIRYVQKDQSTFSQDLVEAIATGKGPDAVILPQDLILKEADKLTIVPFTSLSERDFKDTFIQEGELYLTSNGTLALPFSIDPLVMYWNRDTLSSAGISRYPLTWDEVTSLAASLTNRDNLSTIHQSGVALGEFRNITNAKDLIAALILQTGNPIVAYDHGQAVSVLNSDEGSINSPAQAVLNFYTQFSNPTSQVYSWNRSLPESKQMFISGDLALYFGFASEIAEIHAKNPQLNFDVAPLPQSKNSKDRSTFGQMLGLAIVRTSRNPGATFSTLLSLVSASSITQWTTLTALPPVRRDLLGKRPTDPYLDIFYASALNAKGWLDPDQNGTATIFQTLVEDIVSGKEKVTDALGRADGEINNLIPQTPTNTSS